MSKRVFGIPRDSLEEWWPHVEPHLKRFEVEVGEISAEYIRDLADNAEAQVWAFGDENGTSGVAVTQVRQLLRGRVLVVWVAVGDIREAFETGIQEFERWGQSIGCRYVEIIGRHGWERALPGYKRRAVVLHKPLEAIH